MVMAPLAGIIVDRFRVKKTLFFMVTLLIGVISFFFMFVPKVPLETGVEMECESEIVLIVRADIVQQNTHNNSIFIDGNNEELIMCNVRLNNNIKKNIKMCLGLGWFCLNKCKIMIVHICDEYSLKICQCVKI